MDKEEFIKNFVCVSVGTFYGRHFLDGFDSAFVEIRCSETYNLAERAWEEIEKKRREKERKYNE